MKLVFLDIDGVLNSTEFHAVNQLDETLEMHTLSWWADMLDSVAVLRLNRIIRETGALVIVSSSWRQANPHSVLQTILELRGFKGIVIGTTPRLVGLPRGAEIQAVLSSYSSTPYAILEDEPLGVCELRSHTVYTDPQVGLTDQDVDQAIRILKRP